MQFQKKDRGQVINDLNNLNFTLLGEYRGVSHKALVKCNICGYSWEVQLNTLLKKKKTRGCPNCSHRVRWTTRSVNEALRTRGIQVVGELQKGRHVKSTFKCSKGHVWQAEPESLLGKQQCGCRRCYFEEKKWDTTECDQHLKKFDVFLLEPYKGYNEYHKMKCIICGSSMLATPSKIMQGVSHCLHCKSHNHSKGELWVSQYLDSHDIEYKQEYFWDSCRSKNRPYPFDFYLPQCNVVIEINGEQHYRPINFFGGEKGFENRVAIDQEKRDFLQDIGVTCIDVPYKTNDTRNIILHNMNSILENKHVSLY